MEHDVYICGWTESADGFELWVKSRPHIRASGKTYLEAEDAFLEVIVNHGGAYHAVLEFVPPLSQSKFDRKYSIPEIFIIGGDDLCDIDAPRRIPFETDDERIQRESWYDAFFEAPCCPECRIPGGPRNQRPIRITSIRNSFDGAFVIFAGAWLNIFSERFLELLSTEERQRIQFRPVEHSPKARKQFFELIGPSGPSRVAVAGLKLEGWRCQTCGTQVFGPPHEITSIQKFIARSDLPEPLQQVFTIGIQPNVSLCVTAERWASMVDQPGTRGLTSSRVGVVSDDEVVRTPELPPRTHR